MTSPELERLVEIGKLHREPPNREEFEGLVESAARRLGDAANRELSLDSRFDLAYNAGHALAQAALRWHGYRPTQRYVVFLALAHTLSAPAADWRLLAKCHEERNRIEYEGMPNLGERLVVDLIAVVERLLARVRELPSIEAPGG
ncbi:MAG TPA: hypothetical protein VLA66_01855 [Thermoanaerobaculia bacterium]|nr:hypothetical protein [Thermoanaerobaculia bacterium]